MNGSPANVDRVLDLAEAICDNSASENDFAELDAILLADPVARGRYLDYCRMQTALRLELRSHRAAHKVQERIDVEPAVPALLDAGMISDEAPFAVPRRSPARSFLGSAYHGTVGFFSQEVPLSWLIATVIMGVAILCAWEYKTPRYEQFAESPSPSTVQQPPEPKPEYVGRITGMADCRGSGSSVAPAAAVQVGGKYELAAGLLEITYDSGARVILQGPCTYEVESARGGFLSLGKLTARVETKGEGGRGKVEESGDQKSEIRSPNSPFPVPPSAFVIRTPAAVVTDLGTAFGVEVTREGQTEAHVFQGAIRVASVADGAGNAPHERVCHQGEAVHVGAGDPAVHTIDLRRNVTVGFVRAMPPPQSVRDSQAYAELVLSLHPAAYYRMERPESDKGRQMIIDSAPGGHHGELRLGDKLGAPYVAGRFGDALWLRGPGVCDRAIVLDYPKATGDRLTVAAWVLATGRPQWAMIASNWGVPAAGRENTGQFHLGLFEYRGDLCARVTQRDGQTVEVREGESEPFPVNAWQHVAFVADGTALHLYRNGKEVASAPCAGVLPNPPVASLGIGCRTNRAGTDALASDEPAKSYNYYAWFWPGRIDELAIFNQALSPKNIERLYLGKPSPPQNAEKAATRR